MEKLSIRHLNALRAVERAEQGKSVVINQCDCEECEDLGLLDAQPNGGYQLTEIGRQKLVAAG